MAEFLRIVQYVRSVDDQLEDHFHENVRKDHDMGFLYQLDDGEVF